jgi:hypothetical protein
MVDETEDQNTAEQVFESFKEVADGKVSNYSLLPSPHNAYPHSPT